MKKKIVFSIITIMGLGLTIQAQDYVPKTGGTFNGAVRINGNLIAGSGDWGAFILNGKDNNDWLFNAHNSNNSFHLRTIDAQGAWSNYVLSINRSSGNVGIGTQSPGVKLDVNGKSKIKNALIVDGIDSGNPDAQPEQLRLSAYGVLANRTAMYISNQNPEGYINFIAGGKHGTGSHMQIKSNGNIGIGTTTPDSKLSVNGNIHTREVKVDLSGWSDFVFEEGYELPTLKEVANHIAQQGHLKDIPSAAEVKENGILVGEMNAKLLQKIEELTLYLIAQNDELTSLKKEVTELKAILINK